jgi:predicted RNase H-like HicB family nuclease
MQGAGILQKPKVKRLERAFGNPQRSVREPKYQLIYNLTNSGYICTLPLGSRFMHIHEEVLQAARRAASSRRNWSFTVREIVAALPALNQNTVRTHVVSRCCVNAPKNHPHKWDYFRRIGRGIYRIETKYRTAPSDRLNPGMPGSQEPKAREAPAGLRKKVHAVIQEDGAVYVVECLELPIVTQGGSLDEAVKNFREALALHLEGEDLETLGLVAHPDIQISYDMQAA